MITTLLFLFQKTGEQKTIENTPVRTSSKNPVEGVVDVEIVRITSESLTTSKGLGSMDTIMKETSDDTDQERGAEE
jgi:hypothetical protein